ncbi:hypothetical protein Tco_0866919 [Tanacetum coccineum]
MTVRCFPVCFHLLRGVSFSSLFQLQKWFVSHEQVVLLLFHSLDGSVDEGLMKSLVNYGSRISGCDNSNVKDGYGEKNDVEVESSGECVDEIDKLTEVIGKHEADQHWDVNTAFLTWRAQEEVYISQLEVQDVNDGADVILFRIINFTKSRGIFINQSKYASEIVKKYGLLSTDSVDTPMVEKNKLDEDLQGKQVDATLYRGMIGSLMYLTSSRPDLIYAVCLCARYADGRPTRDCQDTRRSTSGMR